MWSLPAPRGARTTLALAPIPVTQAGWTGQDALPLSLYQALVAAVFRSQESQPQFPMVSPTSNFEFQTPPLWPAIVESYETSVIPTKLASFGQIESRITATHFLRALRRFELPRGAGLRPATPTFLSARLGQPPSHAPRNWLRSVKPTLLPIPKKNRQLQKIGFVWSKPPRGTGLLACPFRSSSAAPAARLRRSSPSRSRNWLRSVKPTLQSQRKIISYRELASFGQTAANGARQEAARRSVLTFSS